MREKVEDKDQKEVEALCPECGHGFKTYMDRVIGRDDAGREKTDMECPVCGCGQCHISKE